MDDHQTPDPNVPTITADDVMPLPTPHLDRARRRARRRRTEAAGRERAARAALDGAERDLARATGQHDAALESLREAEDARRDAAAELARVQARLDSSLAEGDEAADRVAAAQQALDRLEPAERAATSLLDAGAPSGAAERAAHRELLLATAEQVGRLDGPPDTSPLLAWADQLRDGSAPLRDDAHALLEELDALEADWSACGAGDLARDPEVLAADGALEAARDAVAAVQDGRLSTAAGHQARVAIEESHRRRTDLEASGRRAGADELAAAVRDEEAALAHVGFDSWLDFRLTMSGAGVGALVERRRRVVADELAQAEAASQQVRRERAAHHEGLQRRREQLRATAVDELGVDPSMPIADQLRQVLAVPLQVVELAREVQQRGEGARAELLAAEAQHEAISRSIDAATAACERMAAELARRERELDDARDAVAAAQQDASAAVQARTECDALAAAAADDLAEADAAVQDLDRLDHLPEDLDDLVDAVVQLALERSTDRNDHLGDDGPVLRLVDPLADLPVEVTLRLVDALEAVGRPVQLATARRSLRSAMRHRSGVVALVDTRRRRRPFGQRRTREPSPTIR